MKSGFWRKFRDPVRGQSLVEAAVSLSLLLFVLFGLLQFALWMHASNVVRGAVQDGARVWAAEDGAEAAGHLRTSTLLAAGLGGGAEEIEVYATQTDGDTVTVSATGHLRPILPLFDSWTLPLDASASMSKEGFRPSEAGER